MKSCLFYVFPVLVLFLGCYAENDTEKPKTFKLPAVTDTGAIQQLFDPPSAGGLDFSFYNVFTSFVNQTRSTLPKIARHSNFTLIQLGLLGAVGAMAAGIATIVAEGKYFKEQADEEEALKHHHHYKRQDIPGRIAYDLPNSISNEINFIKAPASSPNTSPYGSQPFVNSYVYHNGNQDLSKRRKRDVNFPTDNTNSTEESHRPLRKRIKKKKVESTQENYQVQPSQSYEIPYEMFNSDGNSASSDKGQYYSTDNNNELKNKSKSAKVLTSGKYNFPKGSSSTEKNGYYNYINLEQQSSANPISSNNEYDTNYYQQFISSSQQTSNSQSDPNQKNSAADTLNSYVNLVDSQANYGSSQNPSVEYVQQNNQQAQSNFPGNYYQNPGAPTDSNKGGQTYTNQLYYRNQSQNSANLNDPGNYYAYNNLQIPSQAVADSQPTATPNPSSFQSQNSQTQYLTYQDQNIQQQQSQQYTVQDSQQYVVQQPQQQYTIQDPQQQYLVQQQQYTIQDSQQQYPTQQPQQYPVQQPQQYPVQPPQQYPGQPSQQQIPERGQPQQYQGQQFQQQAAQVQQQQPQQVVQAQQQQPQQQYLAQQPEEAYLQQMQPPLPPNAQSLQANYVPPRRYFQDSNTPSAPVRFPQQQPQQNPYKKNTNRNSQVSGQNSYYMNRPYSSVNSNKRNSHKNFVLPNAPESTTQSLLSRIFNPFGLSLPPRNRKSNLITRSFQKANRVKRVQ